MKKLFSFLLLFSFLNEVCSQSDIRSVEIKDVNGEKVLLSDFSAVKIIFIVVDGSPASVKYAKMLNSLVGENAGFQIMGIAVSDFGLYESDSILARMYSAEGLLFPIVSGSKAKKENAAQKSAIISWLTSSSKNKSYSVEVEEVGQMFILNEKRELYAVVKAKALESQERINRVLNQKFD